MISITFYDQNEMLSSKHTLAAAAGMHLPMQSISCEKIFSWRIELRHLFSKRVLNTIWWPFFKYRQQHFNNDTLDHACNKLPNFTDLWHTILKGSFAYNCLFLGITPLRNKTRTGIVDITTLALFFGDEFIDGLAKEAGKQTLIDMIQKEPGRFYLRQRTRNRRVMLHYPFHLDQLFPAVMQKKNVKYGISYKEFYTILHEFIQLINQELGKLPLQVAERAAGKIVETCNTCFDSFVHDINSCAVDTKIPAPGAVLEAHELKTAYMQTKLLELRCILHDKESCMTSIQMPGWLDIMRVIQIYDDIQDAVIDLGVQDNLVLSVAAHYYPEEWKWICGMKDRICPNGKVLLSLYMPCSMAYCQQLAATHIRSMNWEQQKIMHYLILKTRYSLFETGMAPTNDPGFLMNFYIQIKDSMQHLPDMTIKSFAIDTCMLVPEVRKKLLKKINLADTYPLRYDLYTVKEKTKSGIFDKITGS